MTIGVAGKYCAGKNAVCAILERLGWTIIDLDLLGREELSHKSNEVVRVFGADIVGADGQINRKALGRLVFSDKSKLARLESMTHPGMKARALELRESAEKTVLNAAILHKLGLAGSCDAIFWVKAPLRTRIARARKRDGLGILQILSRIWAQRKLLPKHLGPDADIYIIWNDGKGDLSCAVPEILNSI